MNLLLLCGSMKWFVLALGVGGAIIIISVFVIAAYISIKNDFKEEDIDKR